MYKTPILLHVWSSYYSAIARLVLIEKQVDYKSIIVDMHLGLEHFLPWYVRLNANLSVPTLIHGEKVIASSIEMLSYVNDHFDGPALAPEDPTRLKELHQWLDKHNAIVIENLTMGILLPKSPFVYKKFLKTLHKEIPLCEKRGKKFPDLKDAYDNKINIIKKRIGDFSEENIKETKNAAEKQLLHYLKELENTVTNKNWLLGEQYSLCDIVNTSLFARIEFIKRQDLFNTYPKCGAYWKRLQSRLSFTQANISLSLHPHQMIIAFFLGVLRKLSLLSTEFGV